MELGEGDIMFNVKCLKFKEFGSILLRKFLGVSGMLWEMVEPYVKTRKKRPTGWRTIHPTCMQLAYPVDALQN